MAVVTSCLSQFDDAAAVGVGRRPLAAGERKRAAWSEGAALFASLRIERENFAQYRRDDVLEFGRIFGGRKMTAGEDGAFGVFDLLGGALGHFGSAGEIIVAGEKIDRQLSRYFRAL